MLEQVPVSIIRPGEHARTAGRSWLAGALRQARERTLALFAAFEKELGGAELRVPQGPNLNPPLWELGHVGWFQEWWIARNRERGLGIACNPEAERLPSILPGADALFDSSRVPHDTRWSLPLPNAAELRGYLAKGLAGTLESLASSKEDDASLYFHRLTLLHEDMHCEAAVYMAQSLGLRMDAFMPEAVTAADPIQLKMPGRQWRLGCDGRGFAFDNEQAAHAIDLEPFEIDSTPITWARFLPFVESGGYADARLWTEEGWQWRNLAHSSAPRYVRLVDLQWRHERFGREHPLDQSSPAVHLTGHEAEAWCRWAGRRLPTEAEWEFACSTEAGFQWGDVWEWTASAFRPFPGFAPHPYRDYSAPWFGSRQVLRGACRATSSRIAHPRYRNFFPKDRNDIFAGFRSAR